MKANKLRRAGKKINIFGIFRNVAVFIVIFAIAIFIYIYLRPIRSVLPIKHVVFIGNKHLTDDELKVLAGVHANDSLITISNKKVV